MVLNNTLKFNILEKILMYRSMNNTHKVMLNWFTQGFNKNNFECVPLQQFFFSVLLFFWYNPVATIGQDKIMF